MVSQCQTTYMRISSSVAREPIFPDAAPGSARAAASRFIASCWLPVGRLIDRVSKQSTCVPVHTYTYARTGSSSMVAAWMEQRGEKLPVKKEVSTSKPRIRPGKASLMMLQSWPGASRDRRSIDQVSGLVCDVKANHPHPSSHPTQR